MRKKPFFLTAILGLSVLVLLLTAGATFLNAIRAQERMGLQIMGLTEGKDYKGNKTYNGITAEPSKQAKIMVDMMDDMMDPKADPKL